MAVSPQRSCAQLTTVNGQARPEPGCHSCGIGRESSGDGLPLHYGFLRRLIEMNLAVHVIDPIDRNEMMMAAGFRIVLGQHDTVAAFLVVDGADMFTVRSNHFHVFLNVQTFEHVILPLFSIKTLVERQGSWLRPSLLNWDIQSSAE